MFVASFFIFFSSIKINFTFVLKIMEDSKKGVLCLDRFMFELEEEKKFTVLRKPKNDTKKLNPN